ncbi:MAG TPA: carboxypeptidase-like regulatory domain-containing protein, partial [Bryobacteraceae bacterium]|nr:carboxypeptidase-like regulatory domain-containing protein [Bryobacteraceae bacterium]
MNRFWLAFLLTSSGFAQTGSGGLAGTIVDASSAAIPEVKVAVVNEDSGAQVETFANSDGHYRVPSLLPGSYRVEATKAGFENL